jgi:hypothetical protein
MGHPLSEIPTFCLQVNKRSAAAPFGQGCKPEFVVNVQARHTVTEDGTFDNNLCKVASLTISFDFQTV